MRYLSSILLFLLIKSVCFAQTLPSTTTPPKKDAPKPPPPPLLLVSAGVDGDFRSGNLNRTLLKARLGLEYETAHSIWGFNTSPRYAYGTLNDKKNEDELFADINLTLMAYQQKFYYLGFGIYETSNLRKINERKLGGIGVGYRILGDKNNPKSRYKLAVTTALVSEQTDYYTKSDVKVLRSSTRIKFSGELVKGKVFLNTQAFIQPAIDANNFRWNAITRLVTRISNNLTFSANLENSYESVVPDGAKNSDMIITFGLGYSVGIPWGKKSKINKKDRERKFPAYSANTLPTTLPSQIIGAPIIGAPTKPEEKLVVEKSQESKSNKRFGF